MFDLEQAIADWRQQMLAAGIKSPVPLDELEVHLREVIERQIRSGTDPQQAFVNSVRRMGRAEELEAEFKKAGGVLGWLGEHKQTRLNRVLALLWLAICSWNFLGLAGKIAATPEFLKFRISFDLNWVLFLIIFFWGMIASIRLFAGNHQEARTIRAIAIFGTVAFAISSFTDSIFLAVYALFSAGSIWLLRSPESKKAAQYEP